MKYFSVTFEDRYHLLQQGPTGLLKGKALTFADVRVAMLCTEKTNSA
jgi:hypothetical protein